MLYRGLITKKPLLQKENRSTNKQKEIGKTKRRMQYTYITNNMGKRQQTSTNHDKRIDKMTVRDQERRGRRQRSDRTKLNFEHGAENFINPLGK